MRVVLIAILAMIFSAPAAWAEDVPEFKDFQAGQEYFVLPSPRVLAEADDGRIEVVSFFWYNCGTCFSIDPEINAWAKKLPPDVKLVRMPFSYNPTLDVHARIFFTLRALGLDHDADLTVFKLFQEKRQPVHEPSQLPRLASALKINEKDLIAAYNSPEVTAKMDQMHKLIEDYRLNGVPSMVVNGKYLFDIGTTHGAENYFKLADLLVSRERLAKK